MGPSLLFPDEEPMMRRASDTERPPPQHASPIGYVHARYADLNVYAMRSRSGSTGTLTSSSPTPMQ